MCLLYLWLFNRMLTVRRCDIFAAHAAIDVATVCTVWSGVPEVFGKAIFVWILSCANPCPDKASYLVIHWSNVRWFHLHFHQHWKCPQARIEGANLMTIGWRNPRFVIGSRKCRTTHIFAVKCKVCKDVGKTISPAASDNLHDHMKGNKPQSMMKLKQGGKNNNLLKMWVSSLAPYGLP